MNKTVKGAFAAGTAAVLLMGGAGSLAYWSQEVGGGGTTVTAGKLTLEAQGEAGWKLNGGAQIVDPTSVTVVPGDTFVYTGSFVIGADGKNLAAELSVTEGKADGGLADSVRVTSEFALDGASPAADPVITAANDGDVVTATITVDFPFGEAADNSSQQKTLNLTDYAVTLTQTDASAN